MKKLRPYQIDCLTAIKDAVEEGKHRMLVRMATGGGKTFVFAHLPWVLHSKRVMVIAHREELLKQAVKHFTELSITAEIEKAGQVASTECKVVVASVQTLKNGRLSKFNPADFDLLVIDECHHAMAPSYLRLVNHFNQAIVVGFTATPYRSDKKNLSNVFTDGVVFDLGIVALIKKGYLTPIKMVDQTIFSKFHPRHVFEAYRKHAQDLKSIVFCKDIAHSIDMAEEFTAKGVEALPVYTGMPKEDREVALQKFAENKIQVLTNCNVLTEGFDEPSIKCIVLARKTSSRSLYEQMIGRGVRPFEGKSKLKVVQLIPTPPPMPVPFAVHVHRTWIAVKILIWIAILLGIAWYGYTLCGHQVIAPVETPVATPHVVKACRLRSAPSTKATVIGTVGPADSITVLDKTNTWTKIKVNNKTGWCGCPVESK